MHSGFQMT